MWGISSKFWTNPVGPPCTQLGPVLAAGRRPAVGVLAELQRGAGHGRRLPPRRHQHAPLPPRVHLGHLRGRNLLWRVSQR